MKIFNGKAESEKVLDRLKKEIEKLKIKPSLAVFLVGENKASELYVGLKKRTAEYVGIEFNLYKFKEEIKEKDIIKKIKEVNKDSSVSGIIVQLPLPEAFDTDRVISSIDPKKDVDGFHKKNLKALKEGVPEILPVMPKLILNIVKKNKNDVALYKLKALVNSEVFGESLKGVFLLEGFDLEYLICKNLEKNEIKEFSKEADVLISALGRAEFIKKDMIKDGVFLVDAGISKKNGKVLGDVDFESVKEKVSFLTPVPGGVGPMVVSGLLENIFYVTFKKGTNAGEVKDE